MGKKRKLAQNARPQNNKPLSRKSTNGGGKKSVAPAGKLQNRNSNSGSNSNSNKPPTQQQQHSEPTIPFSPEDKILLVGDGDLSFAASLVEHHYCADVTATVFEKNRDELLEKYPHAAENIDKIEAEDGCRVLFSVDATKMAPFTNRPGRSNNNSSNSNDNDNSNKGSGNSEQQQRHRASPQGVMDRIIFNFPHVGGKSTDVNRQVRYNQELLVSFFQRAIPSLAPGGSIVVTLFEGEPYTLWNIRDLGRHSGLQVERSFRFQAAAYPGYHHARTLGVVRNRSGEAGGGWKGEDRAARSYVFVKKDADVRPPAPSQRGVKRSRKQDDDDSSDED